jgi:hypothetical protein
VTKKRKTIPRSKARPRPRKKSAPLAPENRGKTGAGKKKLDGGHDPSIGKATQFHPGVSGNPGGRPVTKPIVEALREILLADPKMVKRIAQKALMGAQRSHRWFAEVRNMLDGRPVQEVRVTNPTGGDGEPVPFKVDVTSARDKLFALLCGPNEADTPTDAAPADDTHRDP